MVAAKLRQQEGEALVTAHPKSRNRKNEPGVVVYTFNPLISAPTMQRQANLCEF